MLELAEEQVEELIVSLQMILKLLDASNIEVSILPEGISWRRKEEGTILIHGEIFNRIPYDPDYGDENQTCHDCGATRGEYHGLGCDMERCPKCGGQLISCDCNEGEYL